MWYEEIETYKNKYKIAVNSFKTKFLILDNDSKTKEVTSLLSYEVSDFGASLLATDLSSWLKEDGLTNRKVQTLPQLKEEIVSKLGKAVGKTFQLMDVEDYTGDDLD